MFTYLDYIFLWIFWVILLLLFSLNYDKIIKILIWNYIYFWMVLSIYLLLEILKDLNQFFFRLFWDFWPIYVYIFQFLYDFKSMIFLIWYFVILIFILYKTNIWIWTFSNKYYIYFLKAILSPLCIINTFILMQLIILWLKILSKEFIIFSANNFKNDPFIFYSIIFSWVWFFIPWFILILFSIDPNMKFLNLNFLKIWKKSNWHKSSWEQETHWDDWH